MMKDVDIIDLYYEKLSNFTGAKEDFKKEIVEMASRLRLYYINRMIKFFGRRHHNRKLKEKAEFENELKRFYGDLDDQIATNAKYWKDHLAKYSYHYKDVPRR